MKIKTNESIKRVQQSIGVRLAHKAFELGAIKLNTNNPFQWVSGYRMPIYNDNRQLLRDSNTRSLVAEGFSHIIKSLALKVDAIAGTATAGIPYATTLADILKLPLSYVRSSNKAHGLKNRIEGIRADQGYKGNTVVLIEDLISTGGSSINAVKAITHAKGKIPYCLAVFTYGLKASDDNFASLDPPCSPVTLLTYDIMIREALRKGYINSDSAKLLRRWREDPFGWGAANGFPRE